MFIRSQKPVKHGDFNGEQIYIYNLYINNVYKNFDFLAPWNARIFSEQAKCVAYFFWWGGGGREISR